MYLNLEAHGYSYSTRDADPEDNWDRGDSATDWTVEGVTLSTRDGEYALPVDFAVDVGDTVYVVYAVYSTGDTFGHDDGANLEVLSFHKDQAIAERNRASVEGRHNASDKYTMILEFDSGGKVSRHCPWDGYFESLDYVRLESFVVKR